MTKTGRPLQAIVLSEEEKSLLEDLTSSENKGASNRAQAILHSANGLGNKAVAEAIGVTEASISTWRRRYLTKGISGIASTPKTGRRKADLTLTEKQRSCLENLVLSTDSLVEKRAQVILLSASGLDNKTIGKRVGLSHHSVCKWRKNFLAHGIPGLQDAPRTGRKTSKIELSAEEEKVLSNWSNSRSLPESQVKRAKMILLCAQAVPLKEICSRLDTSYSTLGLWRKRFMADRLEGLSDEYRSGRDRTYDEEKVAELLKKTLETKPEGSTHWSCRTMAEASGISASTINRIWRLFEIKPHQQKKFKLSTDPYFVDKVVDVCGLYLNPPDNALVLCVDEKSQCQALERTQPILPMGLGYKEGVTDNYIRHGVTTLFAALDVATGKVEIACKSRHRHQEFLSFLNQIKRNVAPELDVHLVLDNYSTHKHEKVRAWVKRNPRFHFHYTPTYSSWLNQVERWFGIITDKAIRRGSFKNVTQLKDKIENFTEIYNHTPKPFVWTATAEQILEKVGRLCEKLTNL